jgi:hypothetical protein
MITEPKTDRPMHSLRKCWSQDVGAFGIKEIALSLMEAREIIITIYLILKPLFVLLGIRPNLAWRRVCRIG